MVAIRTCQKCGDAVNAEAEYCGNCGSSLEDYPLESGREEGRAGGSQGVKPKTRKALIVAFVILDILVALFLIYLLTQVR